ncbi:hypothetical protein BJ122_102239 [Rhodopseudomonas faecalis]|uniref:Uncharacterized protein n=1 Tax=Rhodopseudomonas faecalis TaxID=99655 RepID=A0A318TKS8_9BRAD|nr:hypothetical protein [Rhodopseudomonas faecalis]PYF05013.1 hypothetical protein BJ122_102239 [Rhodopseudomonas faecalis]
MVSVAINDQRVRRIAGTSDFELVTASDLRRLLNAGFDTNEIGRAYFVHEARVWNRIVHDDPAVRF